MKQQLEVFKSNLETFARKHKKDINKDPQLRKHFQVMCASIGVDPLACELLSNNKTYHSNVSYLNHSKQRFLGGNAGRRGFLL
mmetsp:Transcript_17280/g.21993  ORF Transcript_17280/g.21993 Transcript_17280/m.21993 type:complete len:83 (+) Transcript_17280:25-273(+)